MKRLNVSYLEEILGDEKKMKDGLDFIKGLEPLYAPCRLLGDTLSLRVYTGEG